MSETLLGRTPVAGVPARRPGTIVAAAAVTWLCCAGVVVAACVTLVFLFWVGDGDLLDQFPGSRPYLLGALTVVVLWSVGAAALAWWAMQGRGWARWLLALSSLVVAFASLVTVFSGGIPALTLAGALSVLVLLFTGGANQWYRDQGASS